MCAGDGHSSPHVLTNGPAAPMPVSLPLAGTHMCAMACWAHQCHHTMTFQGPFRHSVHLGHFPKAEAVMVPESKIPSLSRSGFIPALNKRERATCQLFSQSIFH